MTIFVASLHCSSPFEPFELEQMASTAAEFQDMLGAEQQVDIAKLQNAAFFGIPESV